MYGFVHYFNRVGYKNLFCRRKKWQKFAIISSWEWEGTSRDSPHGGAPQDGAIGHSSGSGFVVAGVGPGLFFMAGLAEAQLQEPNRLSKQPGRLGEASLPSGRRTGRENGLKIRIFRKMAEKSQKSAFPGRFGPVFWVLGSKSSPQTGDLAGKQENQENRRGGGLILFSGPFPVFLLKFGSSGKFRSQDPVSVHFLAKDAKNAKKRLPCLKPLGALGALCERNSLARMSGRAGSTSSAFCGFLVPGRNIGLFFLFS